MRSPRTCAISSTQRSTAESIPSPSRSILRKPASAHDSLSHCTIWRPSIAAGWIGHSSASDSVETTMPPECWETWRGRPWASRTSRASARQSLDLDRRQPERLAEVVHRPARAVGREGGDERRAVVAVTLVHARDEDLADVAREVEVDVGERGDLLVEEAPEKEVALDRVDVREAGQVADDRRHARPPAATGRKQGARGVGAAHLVSDLARELEQVAVEQEEAGEAERADDRELLLEPGGGFLAGGAARVALL